MPYTRPTSLPGLIVAALKLYFKKHPVIFSAIAGFFIFAFAGTAMAVMNCGSSCGSKVKSPCSSSYEKVEAAAAQDETPCPYSAKADAEVAEEAGAEDAPCPYSEDKE